MSRGSRGGTMIAVTKKAKKNRDRDEARYSSGMGHPSHSISLVVAGASGFLTFDPVRRPPRAIGPISTRRDDAFHQAHCDGTLPRQSDKPLRSR